MNFISNNIGGTNKSRIIVSAKGSPIPTSFLLVGGGGGGEGGGLGGGGGGGVVQGAATFFKGQTLSINVGSGGTATPSNGGNTSLSAAPGVYPGYLCVAYGGGGGCCNGGTGCGGSR